MFPEAWKPIKIKELTRVGAKQDGGYVIPQVAAEQTELLFGLGVSTDWTFEEEFRRLNPAKIICYDHTLTTRFWAKRFIWDAIMLLGGQRFGRKFGEVFKYLQYRRFFDGKDVIHHQKMVGYEHAGAVSIKKIMENVKDELVFFKIDIEGWEYRILNDLLNLKANVIGFVIEFHDVDLHRDRLDDFINSLSQFDVVHIHANNYGGVDPFGVPMVIEVTFLNKKYVEVDSDDVNERTYPVQGLDYPNDPDSPDISINFS